MDKLKAQHPDIDGEVIRGIMDESIIPDKNPSWVLRKLKKLYPAKNEKTYKPRERTPPRYEDEENGNDQDDIYSENGNNYPMEYS